MIIARRSDHARKLLASQYEKHFLDDCRLRSLVSRLNRCSREYSNSLLSGVPGLRISGHPTVKFECSNLTSVVRSDFTGTWGEEGDGVNRELFESFQEVL